MWFFKLIESFFKRERGEQGSGLMTVLGVSLVVTIAAGTITSSIVMASNFTSEKLSQQQADAAAEAGIADAVHSYQTGNCVASSPMHDSPKYKYNFYRSNSENYPTTSGSSGTYVGCPGEEDSGGTGSKADRWVMIKSTGYGKNNTSKSKTAVFKLEPKNMTVIPQAITANKIDIQYPFNLNAEPAVTGSTASIYTSNFICNVETNDSSRSIINANLKYDSGTNLAPVGNCIINGNIEANISSGNEDVDLNGMEINGNICANKKFKNIEGLKGEKRTSINVPCNYEGQRYGYVPDMSNAIKPTVKACTDWNLLKTQIESASGENNGEGNIFDLTVCGSGVDKAGLRKLTYDDATASGSRDITVKGDISLVFDKGFLWRNSTIKSSSSKKHTVNFILPSKTASDVNSSVPSGADTSFFRDVKYDSGVSGIIYTPYSFTNYIGTEINGQVYAGETYTARGVSTIKYMPVGLPNAEKKIKDIGRAPDLIRVY